MCEPFAIEPLHPDVFLLDLHSLDADEVLGVIERRTSVLRRPPMSLDERLERLAVTVPQFADALRGHA